MRTMSGYCLVAAQVLWAIAAFGDEPVLPIRERLETYCRVIDSEGKPVAGAKVTPWALRAWGHGKWNPDLHGPIEVTITDADGRAAVRYPPTWGVAHAVTQVSVYVDHPEFCVVNHHLAGGRTRQAPESIVLKRGTVIRLQAFDTVASGPSGRVHIEVLSRAAVVPTGQTSAFHLQSPDRPAKGERMQEPMDHWYVSRPLPGDARRLVAVVLQDDEVPLFSPILRWSVDEPASHVILTSVEPGVRFEGKLDHSVPRPVKNGRVCAIATTPPRDPSEEWHCTVWRDVVPIREDGTFVIPSLPRGCDLQLVAMCDGWRSKTPDEAQRRAFAARYDSHVQEIDTRANPQTWSLEGEVMRGIVRMTRTAACRIRCVDPAGEPIAGLTVGFSPNHYFPGAGSWLFAVTSRSIDFLKTGRYDGMDTNMYRAVTNSDGVAEIHNLPPEPQEFAVIQDKLLMLLGDGAESRITPALDEIVEKTVTVKRPVRVDDQGSGVD